MEVFLGRKDKAKKVKSWNVILFRCWIHNLAVVICLNIFSLRELKFTFKRNIIDAIFARVQRKQQKQFLIPGRWVNNISLPLPDLLDHLVIWTHGTFLDPPERKWDPWDLFGTFGTYLEPFSSKTVWMHRQFLTKKSWDCSILEWYRHRKKGMIIWKLSPFKP